MTEKISSKKKNQNLPLHTLMPLIAFDEHEIFPGLKFTAFLRSSLAS